MFDGQTRKLSHIFSGREGKPERDPGVNTIDLNWSELVRGARLKAQRDWFGGIGALEILLGSPNGNFRERGVILSGPTAVVSDTDSLDGFEVGIFTAKAFKQLQWIGFQLPAAEKTIGGEVTERISEWPLLPRDPIAGERFCLVFDGRFCLLMVLGEDEWGLPAFHFSFDPLDVGRGWGLLRERLTVMNHPRLEDLVRKIDRVGLREPDYRLVTAFTRDLLKYREERVFEDRKIVRTVKSEVSPEETTPGIDLELLRALTHEIRTPLTTIRTLTRLLLKRGKVTEDVRKYLETIDLECNEQIDRMELIFRAVELGIDPITDKPIQLVSLPLERVFQDNIPRWQKQAKRRGVELDFSLPQKLPSVVSDRHLLDQMLGALMEKCTRSIVGGGKVRVQVSTAGNQLKLQFYTRSRQENQPLKALGQVLMFQPETGSLSLNMDVTKNLFQALGGKFTVRQKSPESEVLTLFLPLGKFKNGA